MKRFEKTYIRVFVVILLMIAVVLAVFSILMSNLVASFFVKQITDFYTRQSEEIFYNLEQTFKNYQYYAQEIYENSDIRVFMYRGQEDKMVSQNAFHAILNARKPEKNIDDIYVVNYESGFVLNTKEGIAPISQFYDKEWIDGLQLARKDYLYFYCHEVDQVPYLALVLPVQVQKNGSFVVVLFNTQDLDGMLKRYGQENYVKLALQYGGERVIAGELPSATSDSKYDIMIEQQDFYNQNLGLQCHVNIEAFIQTANMLRNSLLAAIVILMSIPVGMLFLMLVRTLKPYNKLAADISRLHLQKKENEEKPGGALPETEFQIIRGCFDYLVHHVETLQKSLNSYEDIIFEDKIRRWLLNGRLFEDMEDMIKEKWDSGGGSDMVICVIRIEKELSFQQDHSYAARKAVKGGIINIALELLGNESYAPIAVDMGSDHVAILLNCLERPKTNLKCSLREIGVQVKRWFGLGLAFAISPPVSIHTDILPVYRRVYELTKLKFLLGEDKIYTEEDGAYVNTRQIPFASPLLIKKIRENIMLQKTGELADNLKELAQPLRGLPYEESRYLLLFYYFDIISRLNRYSDYKSLQEMEQEISDCATISEAMDVICDTLFDISMQVITFEKGTNRNETAMQIEDYIHNHISDPTLNVEEIADSLSFSTIYIRELFKEYYQVSLSDYLLCARIEMAKELLENSNMPVNEIMFSVGIQTKSHFFTTFKNMTGMTPSQWRIFKMQTETDGAGDSSNGIKIKKCTF